MKIGLPSGQPERKKDAKNGDSKKKTFNKPKPKSKSKPKVKRKVLPENIRWRDNGDTISSRIGGDIIYIDKKTFNILLKNGFIIKCKSLDKAKDKAILLFNN